MNDVFARLSVLTVDQKRRLASRMIGRKARAQRSLYAASYGQKALWYLQQLAPENAAYNINTTIRIDSAVAMPALADALNHLIARHESLRTSFVLEDGELVRKIHAGAQLRIEVEDFERRSHAELYQALSQAAWEPFNLAHAPLLRARIFRTSGPQHILSLTVHHIVGDFWSLVIFLRELGELYLSRVAGAPFTPAPAARAYTDFVHWQQDKLDSCEGERLWEFWKTELAGHDGVLELATDFPRPPLFTHEGDAVPFKVDALTLRKVRGLAQQEGATIFAVLLAAYQLLLSRYAGSNDVIVGCPMSGRTEASFADTVGYFTNLVPVRTVVDPQLTLRELVRRVRDGVLRAMAHQDFPFALLVERLKQQRDPKYPPIVQAAFMFEKSQHAEQAGMLPFLAVGLEGRINIGGLSAQPVAIDHRASQFDLTVMVEEANGELMGLLEFNRRVFDRRTIARFGREWVDLLYRLPDAPDRSLADVDVLTPGERRTILHDWNSTARRYPRERGIYELFERQAARRGEAPAVMYGADVLSYYELDRRVRQCADRLARAGVSAEATVGIYLSRRPALIVSMLAVLKLRAAYVPLDPALPPRRIGEMLADSGAALVVTESALSAALANADIRVPHVDVDAPPAPAAQSPAGSHAIGADLAYVIYTSGSTGRPKGVAVRQRSVTNVTLDIAARIGLSQNDTLLAITTVSFDIAALEIFMPLLAGASLRLLPDTDNTNPDAIRDALRDEAVRVLQATPAMWKLLLAAGWAGRDDLTALCGGEALPAELAGQLRQRCRRLINLYGPTETTIWSTAEDLTDPTSATTVPIGRPLANTQVYVLDANRRPLPPPVPGQLYIGGEGLAAGYWKRADLTAERFVPNPLAGTLSETLYLTGDRARWTHDGKLEYLGRGDQQIKIRGFRIEIGEIEESLRSHPGVADAVVSTEDDATGEKVLSAYVIAPGVAPEALREHLRERLPGYAVPGTFSFVERFPLTPNRKVDRQALRACAVKGALAAVDWPLDWREAGLLRIWRDLLQVPVGPDDDFFTLGGHSLMAVRLVSEIERAFGVRLPISALMQTATVRELAALIAARTAAVPSLLERVRQGREDAHGAVLLVPGLGASVLSFRDLIARLPGGCAIYGLEAASLWASPRSIAQVAAECARAVAAELPKPVRIFGHSFGGVLAFEIARQLRNIGHAPASLLLLDALAPMALGEAQRMLLRSSIQSGVSPEFAAQLHGADGVDANALLQYFAAADRVPAAERIDAAAGAHSITVLRNQLNAIEEYQPGRYDGEVTIARASASTTIERILAWRREQDDLGWRRYCAGKLSVLEVEGDHFSLLHSPFVNGLAQRIRSEIFLETPAERTGVAVAGTLACAQPDGGGPPASTQSVTEG